MTKEEFEDKFMNDYDFRGELANRFLSSTQYYFFCKEDSSEYLDDKFEEIREILCG